MRLPISMDTVDKLFPFAICMDQNWNLIHMGPSLQKLAPHLKKGDSILTNFEVISPPVKADTPIEGLTNQLLIIRDIRTKAHLSGQLIRPSIGNLYMLMSNLVVRESEEIVSLGLTFADFAVQDQIFDYILLMQAQKRAIEEANILNEKLSEANQIATRASQMKSQFLANMSHELRTPMNGILGLSSVLMDATELDDEQTDIVKSITHSADNMLALINDILDLSKIESGYIVIEKETVSLTELQREIMNVIAVPAEKKKNRIEFTVASDVQDQLWADRLRLLQILLNLVGNANKFTSEGLVSIRIQKSEKPTHLSFSVQDSGIGMSQETIGKLFNPFVQGDSSTTKKFGGTGLGLAISKRLIEAMGGAIKVTSTPGVGSNFEFEIEFLK